MLNKIIDCKTIASEIRKEIKQAVVDAKARDIYPRLLIMQIGDDRGSEIYSTSLVKSADKLGVRCDYHHHPGNISPNVALAKMRDFAADPKIHGIILQRPVRAPHSEEKLSSLVPPTKDIDCLNPLSMGLLSLGKPRLLPSTPAAIMEILARSGVEIAGKRVAIVGRSNVVGKPLFLLLSRKGSGDATVTLCHTKTQKLSAVLREMEIVIVACGQPGLITGDMLRPGCVVIDAGINQVENKLVGDVELDSVIDKVSLITPVPRGVGPVTRVMLFKNLMMALELNNIY